MNNFINNVNNGQMMKVMAELVFKNYIEDVKASSSQETILYRPFDGTSKVNKSEPYKFILATDLDLLCKKLKGCNN